MIRNISRFQVRPHAFVLMDNHCHLLVELTQPNLSRALQWLTVGDKPMGGIERTGRWPGGSGGGWERGRTWPG